MPCGVAHTFAMVFREIEFGSSDFKKECELRHRVLRIPIGRSLYDENLDMERNQLHFGLFDDQQTLVACVIAVLLSATESKIRQMAVSAEFQKQGHGRRVITSLEEYLSKIKCRKVLLHARASALGFYEKLGYAKVGAEFMEVGLPHFRMEKDLKVGCS